MRRRGLVALCLAAAALAACNAILGYDAATLAEVTLDGGGTIPNTCSAYCTGILSLCTGANREYLAMGGCLAMCGHFDAGVQGDTAGNTLACRISYLAGAQTDPGAACTYAGPLGGGTCGTSPCAAFCALDTALCGGQTASPYGSESACETDCSEYVYDRMDDAGDLTSTAGNSLNCRLYSLESAYDVGGDAGAPVVACIATGQISETCN